jgi:hypothetical protein
LIHRRVTVCAVQRHDTTRHDTRARLDDHAARPTSDSRCVLLGLKVGRPVVLNDLDQLVGLYGSQK